MRCSCELRAAFLALAPQGPVVRREGDEHGPHPDHHVAGLHGIEHRLGHPAVPRDGLGDERHGLGSHELEPGGNGLHGSRVAAPVRQQQHLVSGANVGRLDHVLDAVHHVRDVVVDHVGFLFRHDCVVDPGLVPCNVACVALPRVALGHAGDRRSPLQVIASCRRQEFLRILVNVVPKRNTSPQCGCPLFSPTCKRLPNGS